MHEFIGNLGVARDRLHLTSLRIRPEGVRTTFAFEMTGPGAEGGGAPPSASLQRHRLTFDVVRHPAQGVFAAVLKDERDGVGEVLAGLLLRSALAISPWNFRAVGDVPVAAVPTGTVLLVITIRSPSMEAPMVFAASSTCWRSAEPSSSGGVPTAMKITPEARTASGMSVVKRRRPERRLRSANASRPGS